MCLQKLTKMCFSKKLSVLPKFLKTPHTNISSAKLKPPRIEENALWILHIIDNLCCTYSSIGVRILRILSFLEHFCEFLKTFLDSSLKWIISFKFLHKLFWILQNFSQFFKRFPNLIESMKNRYTDLCTHIHDF